ncbi:hypothetical protein Droror1_Dr00020487, partial [Drosera rotundifolia]
MWGCHDGCGLWGCSCIGFREWGFIGSGGGDVPYYSGYDGFCLGLGKAMGPCPYQRQGSSVLSWLLDRDMNPDLMNRYEQKEDVEDDEDMEPLRARLAAYNLDSSPDNSVV